MGLHCRWSRFSSETRLADYVRADLVADSHEEHGSFSGAGQSLRNGRLWTHRVIDAVLEMRLPGAFFRYRNNAADIPHLQECVENGVISMHALRLHLPVLHPHAEDVGELP